MRKFIHSLPVIAALLGFVCFQNFSRVPARFLPSGERETESTAKLKSQARPLRVPASIQQQYELSQVPVDVKSPDEYLREKLGLKPSVDTLGRVEAKKGNDSESCGAPAMKYADGGACTNQTQEAAVGVNMDVLSGRLQVENLGPVNAEIRFLADQRSVDVDLSHRFSSDAQLKVNLNPREQSGKVNLGIGW